MNRPGIVVRTSRPVFCALLALVTVSVFVCQHAEAQALPVIRVVGPPNDGYKSIYYGMQSGIFRKYGLDVQPTIVNNGAAAAAALVGGAADIAFTNLLAVIQAHLRGVPIQLVSGGPFVTSNPSFTATVVLNESPIRTARDLNGTTIGLQAVRDLNGAALLAWIDQHGGDAKSIHQIEISSAVAVPLMSDKRIDAATLNEPALSQALATGKVRVLMDQMEAIGKRVETGAFAGMAPAIERNRDAMSRFAKAMSEAQSYTNTHPAQTVKIVAGYTGMSEDVVAHGTRVVDAERVDPKDVQPLIDVLAKYGFIDRSFPARELVSPVALPLAR